MRNPTFFTQPRALESSPSTKAHPLPQLSKPRGRRGCVGLAGPSGSRLGGARGGQLPPSGCVEQQPVVRRLRTGSTTQRVRPDGQIHPHVDLSFGLLSAAQLAPSLPLSVSLSHSRSPCRSKATVARRVDRRLCSTLSLSLSLSISRSTLGGRADGSTVGDGGARTGPWAGNGLTGGLRNGLAGRLMEYFLFFLSITRWTF